MIEAPQAARHIAFCFHCWLAPPVATLRANMFSAVDVPPRKKVLWPHARMRATGAEVALRQSNKKNSPSNAGRAGSVE
jgi:hypothetical protein